MSMYPNTVDLKSSINMPNAFLINNLFAAYALRSIPEIDYIIINLTIFPELEIRALLTDSNCKLLVIWDNFSVKLSMKLCSSETMHHLPLKCWINFAINMIGVSGRRQSLYTSRP